MKLDPGLCYAAIVARDARFDGRFYTCVTSTRIFCRPVCPARTPKRENCLFVASAEAAIELGFRACKRCRPEARLGSAVQGATGTTVKRALRLIAEGALDQEPMEPFANRLGLGARHLRRLIRQELGASPKALSLARRVAFAQVLIRGSNLRMTEIAAAAGFNSLRRFNDEVRQTFGASPSVLREGHQEKGTGAPGSQALVLPVQTPWNWQALLDYWRDRAIQGLEVVEGSTYRRTLQLRETAVSLELSAEGQGALYLRLGAVPLSSLYDIVAAVRRATDLDCDTASIEESLSSDPALGAIIRRQKGLRLPQAWGDPFELLMRAILGQQVSVKGARTMAGRLVARFGATVQGPADPTWPGRIFPTAEALATAKTRDLMALGLTSARANTIVACAARVARDPDWLKAGSSLDDTLQKLQSVKGIGPWTANYVAMRALRETDAFPAGDLGLRKALAQGREPLTTIELERRAEAWRPFRAYAAQHLWTSLGADHKQEKRHDLAA